MPSLEQVLDDEKFVNFLKDKHEEEYKQVMIAKAGGLSVPLQVASLVVNLYRFFSGGNENMASISIISPLTGHSVFAGDDARVVVGISSSDFWTLLQNCRVTIRDSDGRKIWEGTGRFHSGTVDIAAKWPVKEGNYSIQSDALNLLGQVICMATAEITVVSKPKDKDAFSSI